MLFSSDHMQIRKHIHVYSSIRSQPIPKVTSFIFRVRCGTLNINLKMQVSLVFHVGSLLLFCTRANK